MPEEKKQKRKRNKLNQNIEEILENDEYKNEEDEILEENDDKNDSKEVLKLKETLSRCQADFTNFKTRVERDREDMIYYLKSDIFKVILPRIDDLERIIEKTPEENKKDSIYEGILSIYNKLVSDLKKQGVEPFNSIGEEINTDLHEVMTQVPGETGIIIEEFEKGYMIGDKVLRVAKVVVGA